MNKSIKTIVIICIIAVGLGYLFFSFQKTTKKSLQDTFTKESIKDVASNESVTQKTVAQIAKYKIEFIAFWSSKAHPNNFANNAHFSPFVAYSHDDSKIARIFEEGQIPTAGIEEMAETGATTILNQEIDAIIVSRRAYMKTQGNVFDSPGNSTSELEFSKEYQYFTFVSMIAPSPDWFVSKTESLIKGGKWVEKVEFNLITYDAGSDSGETLTAEDKDTDPKEPVTVIDNNLQSLEKLF